jgi:hypothetical protein
MLVVTFLRPRSILRSNPNALPKPLIHLGEHRIGRLPHAHIGILQMRRHVVHEVLLLALGATQHLPQRARLHVVLVGDARPEVCGGAGPELVRGREGARGAQRHEGRRVVGLGAGVSEHGHVAVALVRVVRVEWLVDGDLLVVDAQPVALAVGVGEEPCLQDGVGGGFDAGDEVRWREGDLFDLGEVVLGLEGRG